MKKQTISILLLEDTVLEEVKPLLDQELESVFNQYELYLLSDKKKTEKEKTMERMSCGLSFQGYFEKDMSYQRMLQKIHFSDSKKVLLLSTSQEAIYNASCMGLQTCFVNTGVNDMLDLPCTQEVRDVSFFTKRMQKGR